MRRQIDNEMLEMALAGFRAKREEIRQAMAVIEQQLGKKGSASTSAANGDSGAKPKRKLSAAGKKAIQAAVKRRWAAFHAKSKTAKPTAKKAAKKPKRTLSPAAKARLVANLAKARAAKASKRADTPVG